MGEEDKEIHLMILREMDGINKRLDLVSKDVRELLGAKYRILGIVSVISFLVPMVVTVFLK